MALRRVCHYLLPGLMIALLLVPTVLAQETTGGIQGTVKDQTGAVVANATVEVAGAALIGSKKVTTDTAGGYRVTNLPPGSYTLTVAAPGFRQYRQSGVDISAGRLPIIDVTLPVGGATETVEVTSEAPIVDVTSSKVAVTVTQAELFAAPKGRSFQSVIPFAPGARQEPLQSARTGERNTGFQIDGASDSENVYLIDGMNVTNIQNGGVGKNFNMDFVQEVNIKSSSFEAEFGGALGGVVNAVPKQGSNAWHGEFKTYIRTNALNANDPCSVGGNPGATLLGVNCYQRKNPSTSASGRIDQPAQFYIPKKDQRRILEPGFEVGGPLVADRLWLFASYIPTIDVIRRTVNFTGPNPGQRTLTQNFTQHNAYSRLDYRMFNQLRLFAGWTYGYSRWQGSLPNPDSPYGQLNTSAGTDPTTFRSDLGLVLPSAVYSFGGDWTPTSKLVVSARYGYQFLNSEDRGKSEGIRYVYNQTVTGGSTDLSGATFPSAFQKTAGFQNMGSNFQTLHDAYKRKSLNTDASYFLGNFAGSHTFKFGYFWMTQNNDVLSAFKTAFVTLDYNNSYTTQTSTTACNAIIAANVAAYGASAANQCRGKVGFFTVSDGVDNVGNATSTSRALYFQDAWTVGHGLTLNLGLRLDREFIPAYDPTRFDPVEFGFGDKIAPRIGGAYDLFHNGKVKIYGSYGKFFDIMKLGLARGSFGSDYWHDCVYAMDDPDYTKITPTAPGGHGCPASGPAPGVTVGRFIENVDYRATKLDKRDPPIDPNFKPMEQHEYVAGVDWAISPNLGLETRYSRKVLDRTIEDMAITDNLGFYIGNPGTPFADVLRRKVIIDSTVGLVGPFCPNCPGPIGAIRNYDGIEFRLTKRPGAGKWFGNFSYTYSRLRGNYAGLTNTDITDGNGGRHSPNNHRAFDIPVMTYTTTGKIDDGPLATDRPNTFKMFGYYRVPWLSQETWIGFNQLMYQGTPNSTCVSSVGTSSSCQWFEERGTWANITRDATGNFVLGSVDHGSRLPWMFQTDLSVRHEIKVSKAHENYRLTLEGNITNLFNNRSVLARNELMFRTGQVSPTLAGGARFPDDPQVDWNKLMRGYDPIALINQQGLTLSSTYGLPILFQGARTIRLAARFVF